MQKLNLNCQHFQWFSPPPHCEVNICPCPPFDIRHIVRIYIMQSSFQFFNLTYQHTSLRRNAIFTNVTVFSTRNNHIDPSYTKTVEKVLRYVLQHCLSLTNSQRDHIQTNAPSGQTSTTIWLVNEHCDCRYWMLYTTVSKNGGVFSR